MSTPVTTRPSGKRPTRHWRNADAEARRGMIVDVAIKLLHRHGPDAVTIRRVAGKLGVGAMTLYTYVEGQHGLQRDMVRRGFEMLSENCCESDTPENKHSWRDGAKVYLNFAIEYPNLYKLMFDVPMAKDDADLLHGGFQPLLDHVTEELSCQGVSGQRLSREARAAAGRYWIGLHGLAMLAISGRLVVLEGDLDQLIDDLLTGIAPT